MLVVLCNHNAFHFDWQELLQGIKACYYLSCPVRMGLTGVTFSLVQQGAGIHYPVSSELAAGGDCCLSRRGSLLRFTPATFLHARMKSCNAAQWCSILFPHRVHSHSACRLACEQFVDMLSCLNVKDENKLFQRWKFFAISVFWNSSPFAFTPPSSHPCFVSSPNLTCFPPSTLSSETTAFRGVSLLAGVIPVNSCPQ